MKEKYKINGSLAKCDLIGVVSDAEHVGEKIPFCPKVKQNDDEDINVKKKIRTNTTYPPVKILFKIKFIFIIFFNKFLF
jgi:hypothetical protein